MFGIGIPEFIIIFVIALIVLGPDKLPQFARQLARLITELKKAGEDFKSQMDLEVLKDIKHPKEMLREALEAKDTSSGHDADWKPARAQISVDNTEDRPLPPRAQTGSPDAPSGITPKTHPEKQTGEFASKPAGSKPDVN
ncbi:MAG: twin-arginine translocase TatA/TatE family subunit [Dissulfurimicrobium sp.]|uniref:twin-arginine translocase TatA/TatE family subunit n=1 Tax=Dissulfurimicrobium sp. TaxID=2022436 RepID=UPI00404A5CB1